MSRHRGRPSPSWLRPSLPRLISLLAAAALLASQATPSVAAGGVRPHEAQQSLATSPDAGATGSTTDAASEGVQTPSQAYLDAKAHEKDVIAFTPGGRVTVPFRPRATDMWPVGGRVPQELPAGRFSGADILRGLEGDGSQAGVLRDYAGGSGTGMDRASLAAQLAAPPETGQVIPESAASSLRRQVVGFLPYWKLYSQSTVLNYDLLSTIAYFGVEADAAGNIAKSGSGWSGWTSSSMTNVLNAAHAKGTRVVLTIEAFAWSSSEISMQTALLSSSTARLNLARQLAAAVRDRGADGVNVDFEPIASGQGANFTAFIRSLRSELDKIKLGYEITIDVTGFVGNYEAANLVAPGAADAIFLMGYDFRGAGSDPVGSISPLSSAKVYDLSDAVSRFLALIPPSKLLLGLPWYGRAWSTGASTALNAPNKSGSVYGYSVTATYATAKELADDNGYRYDSVENSAWTVYHGNAGEYGTSATYRELYYDDARSLAAKYDFVNQLKLRGSGIWCLGNDGYMDGSTVIRYPDLWKPISDKFATDTTPPDAGIANLSPTQLQEAFNVSWLADDDLSAIASYDVQVSADGGAWTAWLTGTTGTSATYLGVSHHGYAFRVRATDRSGNVGAWDVTSTYVASPTLAKGGFGLVKADQLNVRKGPGLGYDLLGNMAAGQLVSIVAGPQTADGYTWFQVAGPLHQWSPVGEVTETGWVATGGSAQWVVAAHAPNSTYVNSAVTAFAVRGTTSTTAGPRTGLPIAGATPTALTVTWNLLSPATSVTLAVFRRNGTIAGTIPLGAQPAGVDTYQWDGTLAGKPVAAGTYMVQIQVSSGGSSYDSPAPDPFCDAVWSAYGLTLTSTGRWYGADRYATAAAVSGHVDTAGVPAVFVATGANFPDALAAAAVAGRQGAPVLLVSPTGIPSSTAAELTRLRPAKIVVVGSTGVVPNSIATSLASYTTGKVERWYGTDRYGTAASVSSHTYAPGVPVVFVATGLDFPDALSAAAAASKLGGPVLLTQPKSLPAATIAELTRLRPAKIVIIGSSGVVSTTVETALHKYTTGAVERWFGPDRAATSAMVSSKTFGTGVKVAFLATGLDFPDALSGAASAGKLSGPILLVSSPTALAPAVVTELTRLKPARVVVLGGPTAVSDTVLKQAAAYPVGY